MPSGYRGLFIPRAREGRVLFIGYVNICSLMIIKYILIYKKKKKRTIGKVESNLTWQKYIRHTEKPKNEIYNGDIQKPIQIISKNAWPKGDLEHSHPVNYDTITIQVTLKRNKSSLYNKRNLLRKPRNQPILSGFLHVIISHIACLVSVDLAYQSICMKICNIHQRKKKIVPSFPMFAS
jgi:hypothetical protein